MKFIIKIIWCAAIGVISSGDQYIAAEEFKILTHNTTAVQTSPELHARPVSSGVRIYALEVAKEILRSTNQKFSIHDVPLQRGLYELSRRNNIIFLPLRKNEERSSKARWIGPIYRERDFLFSRASLIKNKEVDNTARTTTACTIRGAAFESTLVAHGIDKIIKANSYSNCISMLVLGRVDYAAMPESEALALYPKNGNTDIIKHKLIGESDLYIAASRDVNLEYISAFRIALAAMQKDGRIAKLQADLVDRPLRNLPK